MTATAPVLIAREAELSDLRQRLLQAGERGPGLALVTGPRGVGLTSLVRRVAAEHPGRTLWATAVAWESSVEHGVLSQLLSRTVAPSGPVEGARLLVDELGSEPALVVVDAVARSDEASLQALSTAVRHHPAGRFLVLLVGALGDPAGPVGTAGVLAGVDDRVVVAPLEPSGVQALVAAHGISVHPTLADRLCRHTQGRPAHVAAMVAELPRHVWSDYDPVFPAPAAVAADVTARLGALADGPRALVEAVAVLGESATLPQAAALAGLTTPLPALDEATRSGLLSTAERRRATYLTLPDPMVAAAVRASLGPLRLAEAHLAAAEVVHDSAVRLGHLVDASPLPDPALADELESLAQERAGTGAWSAAADLLAGAARLTADAGLREHRLARSVDALIGSGDGLGAAALIPEVESMRETALRNAVLGYLAVVRGRPGEAESSLRRAWDLVDPERDPATAALVCQRWVLHSLGRCRGDDLVQWADRASSLAPAGSPAAVEAAAIRGLGVAAVGRPQEALEGYVRLAEEVGHGAQAQRVAMGRGWLHLSLDEVEMARSALASALSTDFLGGSTRISLWAHGWLARTQFVAGDWDDALVTARDGLALVDRSGMRLVAPLLAWTQAQVHALRGEWELAEAAVRAGDAGPRDYEIMRVPACVARANVAEAASDYVGVVRALTPLLQPWAGGSIDEPGAWPWADVYANALVVEGRYEEAGAFLAPHEALARERGHRSTRARLGYARGRLLGATGDLPGARACFEEALQLLEDQPLRYDRARVNFAFGQTLRRAGKRREADAVMQTARDLYQTLGATTYVERCERELRAGGVHAVRVDRGVDALTPQEQLVSDLVSRGMTNREVAANLYLSMKTVQYHLTRIYAKLGVRSRTELAALRAPSSGAE